MTLHAGDGARALPKTSGRISSVRALALAPRLHAHAAEAGERLRELEGVPRFRDRHEDLVHLFGVERGLLDGGIRRRLHDAEDDALILLRREFLRRDMRKNGTPQQDDDDGERDRHRPPAERAGERAHVAAAQAVEALVDPAREAFVRVARAQQLRGHHRRKRERDDAGDDDRAGEREGKLAEERAGQAALNADRRIDRGERDRHRDDRPDQFARALQRGVEAA